MSVTVCARTKTPPVRVVIHSIPAAYERWEEARRAGDEAAARRARSELFDLAMLLAFAILTPAERAEYQQQEEADHATN